MENSTNEVLNEEVQTSAEPKQKKLSAKEVGMKLAEGAKNLFSAKNRKKTCLVLLAVIVVVGCIIAFSANNSPKAVAERFLKAGLMQDNAVVCKLTAYDYKAYLLAKERFSVPYTAGSEPSEMDEEDYFEKYADKYDEDIASWKDLFAVQKKLQLETFEDEFGEFELSVEVTREKDMSVKKVTSELEDWLEMLEEKINFDTDMIGECKVLTAKIKIVGEDSTEKETCQVYLCKIKGSWKVLYLG